MTKEKEQSQFHLELRELMDEFVHGVYDLTVHFPKDEMYGVTSQLRRSSLSVVLNYIEGYARKQHNVMRNFLEISYGSLKESRYLLYFSYKRKYCINKDFEKLEMLADRIGRMVWGMLEKM